MSSVFWGVPEEISAVVCHRHHHQIWGEFGEGTGEAQLAPGVFISILAHNTCQAEENIFQQARELQCDRKYDEAIEAYKQYLSLPLSKDNLTDRQIFLYTEALVQLMNTYQSKGEPEACISTLKEVFGCCAPLE